MSKSSSSSSSQSQTQSIQEDNRIVAEDSLVLGKDAIYQINDEFSDNVADAFSGLIDLARDAAGAILDASNKSISVNEKALDTVATIQSETNQGVNAYTQMIPLFVIGALGLVTIMVFKK